MWQVPKQVEPACEASTPEVNAAAIFPLPSAPTGNWSEIDALRFALEAAKSELTAGKELFDKTQGHLLHLQHRITKLREERHFLANRVMEADSLRRKLQLVSTERDRLQSQLDRLPWVRFLAEIRRLFRHITRKSTLNSCATREGAADT